MQFSRTKAYLDLLHHGLVAIRNYAYAKQIQICEIEADHLHNIPTLLEESNEARHQYYILAERSSYLLRLKLLGAFDYLEDRKIWYHEPWKILASISGAELSE